MISPHGVPKGILTLPYLKMWWCGCTDKLGGRLSLKDKIQCWHKQRKGRTVCAARKQVLWLTVLCRMSPPQHHWAMGALNHRSSILAQVGWSLMLCTCTCSALTDYHSCKTLDCKRRVCHSLAMAIWALVLLRDSAEEQRSWEMGLV